MHFWTEQPVLFVGEDSISKIDPRKPENLFGMWSVFSKASGFIENGRRLENMSWRLWQQQTLCPKNKRKARFSVTSSSRPQIDSLSYPPHSIPELSSSVASSCSSHSDQEHATHGQKAHSHNDATRGVLDGDLTSVDLQILLQSIKEKQELTKPLSPLPSPPCKDDGRQPVTVQEIAPTPRTSSPRPTTVESSTSTIESVQTDTTYLSPTNASETSVESGSESSTHSVVRGFKPGGVSTYRSQSQLAPLPTPILKSSAQEARTTVPRTKGGVFQLGGSSGEEESSVGENMSGRSRGSSLRTVHEGPSSGPRKHTAFVDQVTEIAPSKKTFIFADDEDTGAVESDSDEEALEDDEEVSESAIDDDDAWEDEGEPVEPQRQLTFPRVESKPDLVSRRSLLTDNLHQTQRATAMQTAASRTSPLLRRSRTSTPNGPSMPASPTEESPIKFGQDPSAAEGAQSPASATARPIEMTAKNNLHPPQPPMSPRAARRNMVSQELGVSLRKHMLNERQFKNIYANNTNIRRAHTSTDVRRLDATQSHPPLAQSDRKGPVYPISKVKPGSWNDNFDNDLGNYHEKGW